MMMCPRPHPLLLRGRPPRHACSGQVGLVGSTAGDDGGSAGGGGRDSAGGGGGDSAGGAGGSAGGGSTGGGGGGSTGDGGGGVKGRGVKDECSHPLPPLTPCW